MNRSLTLHEVPDLVTLLLGLHLVDQVDLVLEYDEVLQLHDLDRCQVLQGLWLGTGLLNMLHSTASINAIKDRHLHFQRRLAALHPSQLLRSATGDE